MWCMAIWSRSLFSVIEAFYLVRFSKVDSGDTAIRIHVPDGAETNVGNVVGSLFFKADLQVKVDALFAARSLGRSDPRGRVETHFSIESIHTSMGSMSVTKQVGCQCTLRCQNQEHLC